MPARWKACSRSRGLRQYLKEVVEQNPVEEPAHEQLGRSRQARVVVEGEFYSPPLPDSELPETVKKQYHPGWGHLAAFPTKIVVYRIDSVSGIGDDAR
jgi:hypothetical protein